MKKKWILLILSLSCLASTLFSVDIYQLQELGTTSYQWSKGWGINNQGQICGLCGQNEKVFLFYWSPNEGIVVTDIQTSYIPHINNNGQIAGTVEFNGWVYKTLHPFVWDLKKGLQDLGVPPSNYWNQAIARDINDAGEVLLQNKDIGDSKEFLTAIWKEGKFKELPRSEMNGSYKINQNSEVLGILQTSMTTPSIYSLKTNTSKKLLFKNSAYGVDINEKGQIIGEYYSYSLGKWFGFFWDPQKGIVLFKDFHPRSLNNLGHMIGSNDNGDPVFYKNGELQNINQLNQVTIKALTDINDAGQIVGSGIIAGQEQALLITPKL